MLGVWRSKRFRHRRRTGRLRGHSTAAPWTHSMKNQPAAIRPAALVQRAATAAAAFSACPCLLSLRLLSRRRQLRLLAVTELIQPLRKSFSK